MNQVCRKSSFVPTRYVLHPYAPRSDYAQTLSASRLPVLSRRRAYPRRPCPCISRASLPSGRSFNLDCALAQNQLLPALIVQTIPSTTFQTSSTFSFAPSSLASHPSFSFRHNYPLYSVHHQPHPYRQMPARLHITLGVHPVL